MTALVAVSAAIYAIDKPYSYSVPVGMQVQVGMRIQIPFGRANRRCEGIVLELHERLDDGLKSIELVLDAEPVLSQEAIRLAAFMRERYFCTFYDAMKAMLPAGLWYGSTEYFECSNQEKTREETFSRYPLAREILDYLADIGGKGTMAQLKMRFPQVEDLDKVLSYLQKKKYLRSNVSLRQRIKDKTEWVAELVVSAEETMEFALKKKRSAPLQYEVLKLLCAIGRGSAKEICYLTGASMTTIKRLAALGYVTLTTQEAFRRALPDHVPPAKPLTLNEAQQQAFSGLWAQSQRENPGTALLYGVTGSGKTSVYIQLIHRMLDTGKTTLLLVPEISLTPQLIRLLMSHFGEQVAVLHSALRVTERYDEWKRIRQGNARVVIGTRSAVFAPLENLGLLILDEEQEHTYKSENTPRYHAREIAMYRGFKEHALVLLGSATPSLESMYQAKNGAYAFYTLSQRYNGKELPAVEIVDMKAELRRGNNTSISASLRNAMEETMSRGQQSILFLNRRGAGRCLICVDCGAVPSCPRCSVSLTYHLANHRLMCHYCGFSQPAPDRCPDCGGHIKAIGTGTQKVEQELNVLFPGTEILRMDADTVSVTNSHEAILERFRTEKIPILVGTQMVTKGLNFENVTLVGVVDADMSLYVDHYRAAETTFSMITQVVGRSGRGLYPGKAIIQTMTPNHSVIRLAADQNYGAFYDLEITLRQLWKCPPFGDIFTVTFVGLYENNTYASAGIFRKSLEAALKNPFYRDLQIRILGPAPAVVTKVNNTYRYCLTIYGDNQKSFRQLLAYLLQIFSKDKKNRGVTAFADRNSYE